MTTNAIPVRRGCGERKQGGIYGECGLSPFGRPLEDFLMDPPVAVDTEALGLSPIGVTLLPDGSTGATHILDWVGEDFYPNVTDMLEEIRRFGLSRRLPRTLDFARLDARSRMLLVHRRALLLDPAPYVADQTRLCPKGLPDHAPSAQPAPHCAALWWEDVQGGEAVAGSNDPRLLRRSLPSFRYDARRAPDGAAGRTTPAIFASFPLSRLVVIDDPEGNTHAAALERAGLAQLPVELEEA